MMGDVELRALDQIVLKNEDTFVDMSFTLPDIVQHVILCRSPVEIDILSGVVGKDIIRCLNAGDVKSAISYINQSNHDTQTSIIDKALSELHNNLTNLNIRYNATEHFIYNNEEQRLSILSKISEDRDNITEKIALMRNRIEESNICIICFNNPDNKCISKCCKNVYCFACITKWLMSHHNCPLCKEEISIQEDLYVVNPDDDNTTSRSMYSDVDCNGNYYDDMLPGDDEYTKKKNKFENLERIIRLRKPESRFLIFSDFEQSFNQMYKYLCKSGLTYAHIKGNSVDSTVAKYFGDKLQALLVNSRNYGSGLNLENTTDVILFHKFEDQLEKQIIGRAHRPGRTCALKIWYLLNENEM
jgi:SNF2 family DNA or RNA helicase